MCKESHGHQSTRVNNWFRNSPTLTSATIQRAPEAPVVQSNRELTVGTQLLPIAATASNGNAAGSSPMFAAVQNTFTFQWENTTARAPLSRAATEPLNRPINTIVGLHDQLQILPRQTCLIANKLAACLFLNNASISPHS